MQAKHNGQVIFTGETAAYEQIRGELASVLGADVDEFELIYSPEEDELIAHTLIAAAESMPRDVRDIYLLNPNINAGEGRRELAQAEEAAIAPLRTKLQKTQAKRTNAAAITNRGNRRSNSDGDSD